jgi:hypothetical protein
MARSMEAKLFRCRPGVRPLRIPRANPKATQNARVVSMNSSINFAQTNLVLIYKKSSPEHAELLISMPSYHYYHISCPLNLGSK